MEGRWKTSNMLEQEHNIMQDEYADQAEIWFSI